MAITCPCPRTFRLATVAYIEAKAVHGVSPDAAFLLAQLALLTCHVAWRPMEGSVLLELDQLELALAP